MSADPDTTLAVEAAMTDAERATFLARFTGLNPRWKGAKVADVLASLYDVDAHLDIIEPVYQSHGGEVPEPGLLAMAMYAAIYSTSPTMRAAIFAHARDIIDRVRWAEGGAPVKATFAGVVTAVGPDSVTVAHEGVVSLYSHLDAVAVGVGDHLEAGQRIGTLGPTSGRNLDIWVRTHEQAPRAPMTEEASIEIAACEALGEAIDGTPWPPMPDSPFVESSGNRGLLVAVTLWDMGWRIVRRANGG